MAFLSHTKRVVAKSLSLVLTCPIIAVAQGPLPDDAQQVLRQTALQLQMLAERYAATGQVAPARAILDEIRRLQTTLGAPLPFPQTTPLSPAPLLLMGYRNRTGQTFRIRVTAAPTALRRGIWGTDTYTDDSDLSLAVVHAGLLAFGQDGEVLITFQAGQNQYQGSTRNGVSTDNFGSFGGSYRLGRVDAASASLPILPATTGSNTSTLVLSNFVANAGGPIVVGSYFPADDQTLWQLLGGQGSGTRLNLMALRNRLNDSFEFEVTGRTTGTIWGNGVYTDDSDPGVAAVHAGLLAPGERGKVRITILPGQQQYDGTVKNNVSSLRYGQWEGSYRIEGSSKTATSGIGGSASVSGRITDSNGRPIANASVAAMSVGFTDGRRSISETASALTNADGEYHLALVPPGSYLIAATVPRSSLGDPQPVPTYFPGVGTPDAALQIPIRAKQQVVGIDFAAAPAALFKVTGRITNPPPAGVPNVTVVPRGPSKLTASAATLLANSSARRPFGEFELMLPAGSWDVFPVANTRPGNAAVPPAGVPACTAGRTSIEVVDRGVEAGPVTLEETDITGRVLIDPSVLLPGGFSLAMVEVRLLAVDSTPAPLWHHARSTKAGSDGRFTLPAVPPGEYALQISTTIPNAYASDVGTIRVKRESLGPIEVTLRSGGGTVQGTVQIPDGRAITSGKVVLVPAAPRRGNVLLYKQESLTAAGRDFHFINVPPGQYKIFAFENLPAGGAEMNAEFMSQFEELGESIAVTNSGPLRVSVRMIEAEN